MIEWFRSHEVIVWWLAAASAFTFVATLIAVPALVARIPRDYFAHTARHRTHWALQHPAVHAVWLVGKNVLGCVFIVVGIAMLVLPGQGILTIVIGLMLLDYPGKYRLERWLVGRRPVLRAINWLRVRANQAPLALQDEQSSDAESGTD